MKQFEIVRAALPDSASAAHRALNEIEERHTTIGELFARAAASVPLSSGFVCGQCLTEYPEDRNGTTCENCGRGVIHQQDDMS